VCAVCVRGVKGESEDFWVLSGWYDFVLQLYVKCGVDLFWCGCGCGVFCVYEELILRAPVFDLCYVWLCCLL